MHSPISAALTARRRPLSAVWRAALLLGALAALVLAVPRAGHAQAGAEDGRCFELRTYTAPDGNLDALNRRFRKYSRIVFARHRMDPMGFWIPLDNPENHFVYMLAYEDCADRDPAWTQFEADSLWQQVLEITEHNRDLVTNVDHRMLTTTDFSPYFGPSAREQERIFELRVYTTPPGKRDDLLARFRNHTMDIFRKHGMENVAYWLPRDNDNQLVYMLAFPSRFARHEAWREFDRDPEWQRAYEASRADGPLVENVESTLLRPTDYSPLR